MSCIYLLYHLKWNNFMASEFKGTLDFYASFLTPLFSFSRQELFNWKEGFSIS